MTIELLNNLNSAQQEAVKHIDGPLLILAGAGSGKTKTITTRLAYLIGEVGIDPQNTLTLTFTNKASKEMRSRAMALINNNQKTIPLLCTFHKFGLIFLKFHIDKIGRENSFVIIDSEDRKKILKKISKENDIDLNLSFISSEISRYKNTLLTPDEVISRTDLSDYKKIATVYKYYQQEIELNNLVDFDDLLMLPYKILRDNDKLRRDISNRYRYIMVDEYQDTNELQFKLLQLLASEHSNLCVVGDDDQSIYGWRGASSRNILKFPKIFKGTKVIKLEINYRSTEPILKVANELIDYNRQRVSKRLISYRGDGKSVRIFHSLSEKLEARAIAKEIKELLAKKVPSSEIAVLYRINALSRSLEEGFIKEGLGFKILDDTPFYDRPEIKDIISYFRVIANSHDDFSLERIINRPRRGVGGVSVDRLKKLAFEEHYSLFQILDIKSRKELSKIISNKGFINLKRLVLDIKQLIDLSKESLTDFIDKFEEIIQIKTYYEKFKDGDDRVRNIDEFYGYFREFVENNWNKSLDDFLNEVSLQSEEYQVDENAINIMSVHASKGLEFEYLYVIGLEEEFFPIIGDGYSMEEERRLAYVAITRAKSNLTLCYVNSRFYKGQRRVMMRSRFLGEAGLIKGEKLKITKESKFIKGDLVKHKKFGIGRVQSSTKSGRQYKLNINFGGIKKEILSSFVESV